MKKVVLLGDSIRLVGYGPRVPELLGSDYEVYQPDENCRFVSIPCGDCLNAVRILPGRISSTGIMGFGTPQTCSAMESLLPAKRNM